MVLSIGLAILVLLVVVSLWWPWLVQYGRLSWRWPLGFSLVVLILIMLGYRQLGHYTAVQQEALRLQEAQRLNNMLDKQSSDPTLSRLQQRIRLAPDKGDGWYSLAQHYLYRNEFEDALIALQQAERLQGASARFDAARATVFYYRSGQKMTGDVTYWLQQALTKDPMQYTALMLQAADNFTHDRYAQAIAIWQQLLESGNPQVDRAVIIRAITLARVMQQAE
ncbi:TPR domain-containing protein [Yersinia enterocolitica]|uniref:TPR domain-containing protein n=1 Tax=unclassified Yersinia (in: enterobacteria) TaxID=2653513 RepID=UPI0009F4D5FC|nr:cytochrome C heme lyase [Yersinia enterocolitica]